MMMYKSRELKRLWEIEVFDGDKEDPDCPTKIETVIAFNAVDAIRRTGNNAAKQPVVKCFVTYPNSKGEVFRIDSTAGPSEEKIEPSVSPKELADEDWQ